MKIPVFAIAMGMMSSVSLSGELVVFSRENCPPCKSFKAELDKNPEIAAGHRVVFAEQDSELWQKLGVKSTPTFMLFSESGELLKSKSGYRNSREFARWLRD